MNLDWIPCPIEIWERRRDCFESVVPGGVYRVARFAFEEESRGLRFHLAYHGADSWGVCYRGAFFPNPHAMDTEQPRAADFSGYLRTLEEAKQWCQDREDRHQAQTGNPPPEEVSDTTASPGPE